MRPIIDVGELFRLLASGARHPEGDGPAEALDQLSHALQCADLLAARHPGDVELQVAGLVHDIGHLLVPGDDAGHGRHAADAIRPLLGPRVAALVELHVPAKRYLVATEPAYRAMLSPVSRLTLERQGGTMPAGERAELEREPELDAALALRRADEAAKEPGRPVAGLDRWRPVIDALVASPT